MEHKESYFWFLRLSGVAIATSLSRSTQDFLKLLIHMFPYNEVLKVFKSNLISEKALQNTSKYHISGISVKGFGSLQASEI